MIGSCVRHFLCVCFGNFYSINFETFEPQSGRAIVANFFGALFD